MDFKFFHWRDFMRIKPEAKDMSDAEAKDIICNLVAGANGCKIMELIANSGIVSCARAHGKDILKLIETLVKEKRLVEVEQSSFT